MLNLIILLFSIVTGLHGQPAPPNVIQGEIVSHRAFPAVLENFPERRRSNVAGYIGVNNCGEMGDLYVLVRPGVPDALVAVADCAQDRHVAMRVQRGIIADVDIAVWDGPEIPQQAELWRPEDRELYWSRMERIK